MDDQPVLVLTQRFDPTADYVIEELGRRRVPVIRCDPGEFPRHVTMSAWFGSGRWDCVIRIGSRTVRGGEVRCAWYRRPSQFEFPDGLADVRWARAEARAGFGGVVAALPRWLNHPAEIGRAEYKPVQLAAAEAVGLAVPKTLITNDPAEAVAFAESVGSVVYMPLTAAPISGGRVLYTTPIATGDLDASVSYTAHMFQARVEKGYEVRATVVDDAVLAARIDSRPGEALVDWRSDPGSVRYSRTALPDDVVDRLCQLVNALRLRFAAVDLIVDPHGQVWFLEANPNGQWAWIEDATGLPITAAITDALLKEPA